ncbi:MAG TPA: hypothetical protein VFE18_13590 [Phenylobacterium sp.]|jgi:hypothetical protein|uniref:hypothetical protein n=1 Tax=Phenylobacterium sp. TaxID=1871053 RepID=UPI002D31B779|nr:hypothetical protein [Phenylobacterium sp.]HZZ69200.1 hypothetical protein [Phenylobacterium sp.]
MRKLLLIGVAGATLLGAAAIGQAASAQAYVVYPTPAPAVEPGYRYDAYGRPYYDDGYRAPDVYVGEAGSAIGPALVEGYASVPYDRYGPDPNGMVAPDGHRIKCKLDDTYDGRLDRYITRRVCN